MNALKAIKSRVAVGIALAALLLGGAEGRAQNSNRSPILRAAFGALTNNNDYAEFREKNRRGVDLLDHGKAADAEKQFQTAFSLGEKIFPPENPNLAVVTINLVTALFEQKKFPEAEAAGRHLLQLQEKNPRPQDTNVMQVRQLTAIALEKEGKFEEATREFSSLVTAMSEVYGPESREALRARNLEAVNLDAQRKYAEAAREFAAILPLQERALGKDDPETAQTRTNLAQAEKNKAVPLDADTIKGWFFLLIYGAAILGFGLPFSIKQNRKLRARNPGVRSYRWGYMCGLTAMVGLGFAFLMSLTMFFDPFAPLAVMLETVGVMTVLGIFGTYAFLRKRWAVAGGILLTGALLVRAGEMTKSALVVGLIWVAGNLFYLGRRWREMAKEENGRYLDLSSKLDARPPSATRPPADWRERMLAVLRHPEVHEPTGEFAAPAKRGILKTIGRMTLLTLAGIVIVGLAMWALVAVVMWLKIPEAYISGFFVVLGLGFVVAMIMWIPRGQNIRLRAIQKHLGYSAIEQVEKGKYPPALYLRAFNFDARAAAIPLWQRFMGYLLVWWPASTPELDLALLLHKRKVPMLAIGRPGEKEPPAGAARVYVSEAYWQSFVRETVPLSLFVIWATGYTAGLRWELEHLVTNVSPRRLLLWPHVGLGRWSEKEQQADWARFLERFQGAFPKPLPENISGIEYIAFEDDWTPRFFPNPRQQFSIWERFMMFPPRLFLRDFLKESLA